jgi:hypothetical protein
MNGRRIFTAAVTLTIVLSGCGSETIIDDSCFVDLAPITSRSNLVQVGDTLTFQASLGPAECLPAGVEAPDWRWSSLDTLIVRIDSLSGFARAVGPGLGPIHVRHSREPSVQSNTILQVQAELQ